MNHYNSFELVINKISNFSLCKYKGSKIFGVNKSIRSKFKNQNNQINSTIPFERKHLIIHKIINLKFSQIEKKQKNCINNEKSLMSKNSLDIKNVSSFKDKEMKNTGKKSVLNKGRPKICKNEWFKNNNNVLIKPIMAEDDILAKKKNLIQNSELKKTNEEKHTYSNNIFNTNPCFPNFLYPNSNNNYYFNNFLTNKFNFLNPFIFDYKNFFRFQNKEKDESFVNNPKILNNNYLNNNIFQKDDLNNLKINNNFDFINLKNLSNKFKTEKNISNIPNENKINENTTTQGTTKILIKNKIASENKRKSKGRKSKKSQDFNSDSKHTKYSADNMMRKIKNKVIESSRLLVNRILKDEISTNKNVKFNLLQREFRKIQGSFSQELNIKYNFWFYQIKIKDIFCLEISNKYTAIKRSSNKELLDYLYSSFNEGFFPKTKQLLNMPFHQYYHDIFLGQEPNWIINYGIKDNENKYQIHHLLKILEQEGGKGEEELNKNKKYIDEISKLAHNYEDFFLTKKPRNVGYSKKRNDFIKSFMNDTPDYKYLKLRQEVKILKIYYENRNNNLIDKNILILGNNQRSEETIDNSFNKQNINLSLHQFDKSDDYLTLFNYKEKDAIIPKTNINSNFMILDEKDIKGEEPDNIENLYKNINNNIDVDNKNKTNINNLCQRKRKSSRIKYFISCKK